jgi:hypothetical protein
VENLFDNFQVTPLPQWQCGVVRDDFNTTEVIYNVQNTDKIETDGIYYMTTGNDVKTTVFDFYATNNNETTDLWSFFSACDSNNVAEYAHFEDWHNRFPIGVSLVKLQC